MIWQDILITSVNIIFNISLLNQVVSGFKEKTSSISTLTSLPTSIGLFLMAFAFTTLGLYLSAIFTSIAGVLWGILLFQKIKYTK